MALKMTQETCIWPTSPHYSRQSNAFSESWPTNEPRATAHSDPPHATLPIWAWHPEAHIPIHISYSTHVFLSLWLPVFNAPLALCTTRILNISYFLLQEKQTQKAWQSQLPTDILSSLHQKPGAGSDKKAAESGGCTESSKRQWWHDNLQGPESTFVRPGGWDCIKLHFIMKKGVPCGCFTTFNLMSFLSSDQSTPYFLSNDDLWVLTLQAKIRLTH